LTEVADFSACVDAEGQYIDAAIAKALSPTISTISYTTVRCSATYININWTKSAHHRQVYTSDI